MKNLIYCLILIFTFCLQSCKKSTPDIFAEEVFKHVQYKGQPEILCISLEDFLELVERVDNIKVTEKELQDIVEHWETTKENYFSGLMRAGNDFVYFTNTPIDSITYGYLIPKTGNDSLCLWPDGYNWPESKKYDIEVDKFTTSFIDIYFNISESIYILSFDAVYDHPDWKILPIRYREMRIRKIE